MFWQVTLDLLEGFGTTLKLFGLTLLFALPLGLIISFGSMSRFKPLKAIIKTFVWIIRGTPLMLQMIVIYYGPGLLGNYASRVEDPGFFVSWLATWSVFDRFVAVLVAFVINYACYFSEIYRGGIEGIPIGQKEAGQVLGMTKAQIFFKITLLQVIKRIVPPMSNEVITLTKDTSLARVIGLAEIIMSAERFTKQGLIWPLFSTGLYFLVFNGLLSLLFGWIEKKMDYFRV